MDLEEQNSLFGENKPISIGQKFVRQSNMLRQKGSVTAERGVGTHGIEPQRQEKLNGILEKVWALLGQELPMCCLKPHIQEGGNECLGLTPL